MLQIPDIISECTFKAVRSGGKGGQNVNKVSSKVELYFNIHNSNILSNEQKLILLQIWNNLLNEEGSIRITSDKHRSQLQNKEEAILKIKKLILKAFTPTKKRVQTKTPKIEKIKRVEAKKKKSEVKAWRKKPDID